MKAGEPGSFPLVVPARQARELLANSLELLQRRPKPASGVTAAIEHTALASSSLYRVEAEARTPEAAAHGIHAAVERLGYALDSLSTARQQHSEYEAAAAVLSRVLALLYPLARATARPRREVVVGPELTDPDRSGMGDSKGTNPTVKQPSVAPPSERRSSPARVRLDVDIGVFSESTFYAGLSLDVSNGGVFVSTHQLLAIGTPVTLYFVLPNGHPVEARGIVRWTRPPSTDIPPGMGVQFTELSQPDLAHIREYCQEQPPLYLDPDS